MEGVEAWLAIETSTDVGSVAVDGERGRVEVTFGIRATHSELMVPAIDRALKMAGVRPGEVSAVVVGSGPGSFTGVRIAASLAKGWTAARGTPLHAYPSLLGVAAGSGAAGPVCALFDARRGEVYAACYELDFDPGRVRERLAPLATSIDGLCESIRERSLVPAFVGEGAQVYKEALLRGCPGSRVLPEHLGMPRAMNLVWLARQVPELGRVAEPGGWEPLYLREWKVRERAQDSE